MTGPKGSSEFCFPETPSVPRGEAKGNIEVEGPVINREKMRRNYLLGTR